MAGLRPGTITSISDSIQSSKASSLSSCISLSGSRRQLSIRFAEACGYDKNEWKRDNDEPDAPLLLQADEAPEDFDVVIGGEQRNESNHKASDSLKHSRRI